jgi:hypothetical protein
VRNTGLRTLAEENADDYRDFLELEESVLLGVDGVLPVDLDEDLSSSSLPGERPFLFFLNHNILRG